MTNRMQKRISGNPVDLVEIAPRYFAAVIRWRNDRDNRRCFLSKSKFTQESQQKWYRSYKRNPRDFTFVIILKPARPVGMLGL